MPKCFGVVFLEDNSPPCCPEQFQRRLGYAIENYGYKAVKKTTTPEYMCTFGFWWIKQHVIRNWVYIVINIPLNFSTLIRWKWNCSPPLTPQNKNILVKFLVAEHGVPISSSYLIGVSCFPLRVMFLQSFLFLTPIKCQRGMLWWYYSCRALQIRKLNSWRTATEAIEEWKDLGQYVYSCQPY